MASLAPTKSFPNVLFPEPFDPLTTILWTGDEVVSQSISKRALKDLKDLFSNPIIIWDNYYANDYCPSRFYIGPYSGRKSLINEVKGIGINPTGLPFTDMICLSRSAGDKTNQQIFEEIGSLFLAHQFYLLLTCNFLIPYHYSYK